MGRESDEGYGVVIDTGYTDIQKDGDVDDLAYTRSGSEGAEMETFPT